MLTHDTRKGPRPQHYNDQLGHAIDVMPARGKKLEIHGRDGSRSSTLRGRGNSRSPKRKIALDKAIRVWRL